MSAMKRRDLVVLLAGPSLLPGWAAAQPSGPAKRIGVLIPYVADDAASQSHVAVFRTALEQLGWMDGKNLHVDYRWAGGDFGRMPDLVKELVAAGSDVLLVRSTPAALAAMKQGNNTPVVFVVVSDPVGDGLVASLARPGGAVTGFSNVESSLAGKWLQLLTEIAPRVRRVSCLFNPAVSPGGGTYYLRLLEPAAAALGVGLVPAPVHDAGEIARVAQALSSDANGGLVVTPDPTTTMYRMDIVTQAAAHKIPAIFPFPSASTEGGLISYGVDVADLYRRSAGYVDRILRGARPGDLPVQAPAKFELAINIRTARTLGLSVPLTLLATADQVVE